MTALTDFFRKLENEGKISGEKDVFNAPVTQVEARTQYITIPGKRSVAAVMEFFEKQGRKTSRLSTMEAWGTVN